MHTPNLEVLLARLEMTHEEFEWAWKVRNDYLPRTVRKKSGGIRQIQVPHPDLLLFQRKLNKCILRNQSMPWCVHGSIPKHSFKTHASSHKHARAAFIIDFKDAFTQAKSARVWRALELIGFGQHIAERVTEMTTFRQHPLRQGYLPQGAATSNALWNLICRPMDLELNLWAKMQSGEGDSSLGWRGEQRVFPRSPLKYTRYTDELVLSHPVYVRPQERRMFIEMVEGFGFKINLKKTRYQDLRRGHLQITGVSVGEGRVHLTKARIRRYRGLIHRAATDLTIPIERIGGIIAHIQHVYGGWLPRQVETAYHHFLNTRPTPE